MVKPTSKFARLTGACLLSSCIAIAPHANAGIISDFFDNLFGNGNNTPAAPAVAPEPDPADGIRTVITDGILGLTGVLFEISFIDQALENALAERTAVPIARRTNVQTHQGRAVPVPIRVAHDNTTGQTLSYQIVKQPSFGSVSGTFPNVTYTPNADFTGFDSFDFEVSDGVDGSDINSVDIQVTGSFTPFESGQVRPLALNSNNTRLYAVNTPDNRLEVFDVTGAEPELINSIPVGLEPVAIALRNDNEAWVVNHLSDSVSIVDLDASVPFVERTLLVGDEPRDVVFAGANKDRAFVTTAHRGQNSPVDPALLTPSTPRTDVWVFEASALSADATMGGDPLTILNLFGNTPRPLAVSPDGNTVYAGVFMSGNQTAVVGPNNTTFGFNSTKDGKPFPVTDASGKLQPNTGIIVKFNGRHWVDERGIWWDSFVPFSLPDYDVFAIDAAADIPVQSNVYTGVGTTLFNIAVNPQSGALYVSNLEARNEVRFEGAGDRLFPGRETVRGHFVESRITVIKNGDVAPRHLNKHINYDSFPGTAEENANALALPSDMTISADGNTLYVAATGSSKVGIFSTQELENDSFVPNDANHIDLSSGGPSGVILDEARDRLYVLTRFDNGISVVDTNSKAETAHVQMYNPEPEYITEGRKVFYDTRNASSRGDSSCAGCHIYGDFDLLAWDLGNPDEEYLLHGNEYVSSPGTLLGNRAFHPNKGPMTTQSLRGMKFQGPQHWRGDRTGSVRVEGEQLERAAFKEFIGAFEGLLGRAEPLPLDQMNAFADFILQVEYPPNPIRNLDNSLTAAQQNGLDLFVNMPSTGFIGNEGNDVSLVTCNNCHEYNPLAHRFGSSSLMSFEGLEQSQDLKVPHLRNMYQKVGMFGASRRTGTTAFMGDQVSGFGFSHDGAADTLFTFLTSTNFHIPDEPLLDVIDFIMVMDSNLAPIVGQQITLTAENPAAGSRVDLLVERALAHLDNNSAFTVQRPECDLVVRGVVAGSEKAWLLAEDGLFYGDSASDVAASDAELRGLAATPGNALTYLCVPPGAGNRIALDRDEDGILNGDDADIAGVAISSVGPEFPNAATEVDERVSAEDGGFIIEQVLDFLGLFPSFRVF